MRKSYNNNYTLGETFITFYHTLKRGLFLIFYHTLKRELLLKLGG